MRLDVEFIDGLDAGGASLITYDAAATVTLDTPEADDMWTPWTTIVSSTAVAEAGIHFYDGGIHGTISAYPGAPALSGGGDRVQLEVKIVRVRGSVTTELVAENEYVRNAANASGQNYRESTIEAYIQLHWYDDAEVGDIIHVQARIIAQSSNRRRMTFTNTDQHLEVVAVGGHTINMSTGVEKTPRRVAELPTDFEEAEWMYLTAPEVLDIVHIVPHSFELGPLAGEGFGERGWYEDSAIDYGEGTLYGSLPHILLVSDTKVAIAASNDPATGLTKIFLGDTEHALTRDAGNQGVTLGNIEGATLVDVYDITGGLPAGNWEKIKIEGPTGTFIPSEASTVRDVGLYYGQDNFLHRYLFDAPLGNINFPFTIAVTQTLPASPVNKSLTFTDRQDSDHPYVVQMPFGADENVARIEMYTETGNPRPNQYTVVMDDPVSGKNIPIKLKVEADIYDLVPVRGATDHSFHTPTIPVRNRVSGTVLERGMDVQYADGSWAEGGGGITLPYTIEDQVLRRRMQEAHSGSDFPTEPYDGEIFTTTHTTSVGAPGTYIYANDAWGLINVRTVAEAEALIKSIVEDWAEVGNAAKVPTSKIDVDGIGDTVLDRANQIYATYQGLPYPSPHRLDRTEYARALAQFQRHTGGLPMRIPVAFPPFNQRAWQVPPGQSNHGYTEGNASVYVGELPPFQRRFLYYPNTHYRRALNDRFRFYLDPTFETNRSPTHLGVAETEVGAITRVAIAKDSGTNEWTSDKIGVSGLRVPTTGKTLYFSLFNAAGEELILNPDEYGQGSAPLNDLTYKLWSLDQGNNKGQIAALGNNQFATPSTWQTPLDVSDLPPKTKMFFIFHLDGRVYRVQSNSILVDEFKTLNTITSIDADRNIKQEIMPGGGSVSYSHTPNCYSANFTGQDVLYIGIRAGQLTIASNNIAYWRESASDFEVWIETV